MTHIILDDVNCAVDKTLREIDKFENTDKNDENALYKSALRLQLHLTTIKLIVGAKNFGDLHFFGTMLDKATKTIRNHENKIEKRICA